MSHKIEKGQVYKSCQPVRSMPGEHYTRIKVVGEPSTIPGIWGFGKVVVVTLTEDGREVRQRAIECSQLHATSTTRQGNPRRTGYHLVEEA